MKARWMISTLPFLAAAAAAWAAPDAKAPAAAPPMPTLSAEGKRWVEGMRGKWTDKNTEMQMGDQKMVGKMTIACDAASGGWATICKGKFEVKGMPTQELTMMLGWDTPENTAHMFEVANTGEVHDHSGKWADEKTISMARTGKNVAGQTETDTVTFNWVSPKELKVSGEGKQGATTAWSFVSTMKK